MKIIKFREVLHTIANKGGFDPEQGNFLENQAIPIGRYIDQWVRRVYDGRDWPELVVTREFEPENHVVRYEGIDEVYGFEQAFRLGRVLKVYLVDPRATAAPVSTDYNLLMAGVHVGHEHGTSVWIRYLFPPPRYTCEVWDANRSYQKDEVTYSPVSGECYRSRVYNNRNHDPGHSFQIPPLPPDENPPEPESDVQPEVVVFQEYIPHDPGHPGQTKIMQVRVYAYYPRSEVPDPATADDDFSVRITDADQVEIALEVVSGPNALDEITEDLVSALTSATGFSVVVDPLEDRAFIIENLSDFGVEANYLHSGPGDSFTLSYRLVTIQRQTYIEPRPAVEGQAQATYIQLSAETTIPGALYRLTMTDGDGVPHPVEYQSLVSDGMAQIIVGWATAIDESTDEFWEGVQRQANPGVGILFLAINDNASTNAVILLIGDPNWEWNPFPQVLAEPVIEGALSDLYVEWGQTDKAQATKGGVAADVDVNATEFAPTPNPPLSGQQVPTSRYKA